MTGITHHTQLHKTITKEKKLVEKETQQKKAKYASIKGNSLSRKQLSLWLSYLESIFCIVLRKFVIAVTIIL